MYARVRGLSESLIPGGVYFSIFLKIPKIYTKRRRDKEEKGAEIGREEESRREWSRILRVRRAPSLIRADVADVSLPYFFLPRLRKMNYPRRYRRPAFFAARYTHILTDILRVRIFRITTNTGLDNTERKGRKRRKERDGVQKRKHKREIFARTNRYRATTSLQQPPVGRENIFARISIHRTNSRLRAMEMRRVRGASRVAEPKVPQQQRQQPARRYQGRKEREREG